MWFATFGDEGRTDITMLTMPALNLTGDRTVTMDARLGRAIQVTVPRPAATQVHAEALFTMRAARGRDVLEGGVSVFGGGFDQIRTAQVGDAAPVAGYTAELVGTWARSGPDGSTDNSPYTYSTTHYRKGGMFTGYRQAVTEAELATVTTRHLSGSDGSFGRWYATSRQPGQERLSGATLLRYDTPATVTHHYTTEGGVEWRSAMYDVTEDDGPVGTLATPYTHYEPRAYAQTWNQAVFGPVLATPVHGTRNTWVGVVRDHGTVSVDLPLYGDAAGNIGFGGDSGSTVLYRDGVELGRTDRGGSGAFTVPAADGAYRLEVRSTRGAPYSLSTKVDASWSFRSQQVEAWTALPLWVVRFAPRLDDRHSAAAGSALTVPVAVTAQPGAHVGRLRAVTVEVSYDDGATWSTTDLRGGVVVLRHPTGSGFVSLRATASDTAGNSTTQTIVRAYRYG
jgi:hypothetical protein